MLNKSEPKSDTGEPGKLIQRFAKAVRQRQ